MFREARKSYNSNGFLLQYKKRLQRSLISIAPSYFYTICYYYVIQYPRLVDIEVHYLRPKVGNSMSSTFISSKYIGNRRDKSEKMERSSDWNPICVSDTVQVTVTQPLTLAMKWRSRLNTVTFFIRPLNNCFIRSADQFFLKHVQSLGRTGTFLD